MRKLRRIMKLKIIFKYWLRYLKTATLDTKNKQLKYCVKYSEWCKCPKCNKERETIKDIMPQRKFLDMDESINERIMGNNSFYAEPSQ